MAVDVIIDPLTGQIYWNDSQGTAQSIAISGNGTDLIKTVGYSLQFSAAPAGTITTGSATTAVTGSGTNFLTLFGSGAAGSGAVLYTSQGTSIGTVSTVSSDTALSLQANASASYTGITFRYSPPAGTDRLIFSDSSTPIYPATTGANLGTSSYRWSLYASAGDITNSGTTAINLMLDKSGIGSTESPALQFINTSAATSGAQYQFAPWSEFRGKAWNTGTLASNDVRMRVGMAALSGNTPTSEFVIASSVDTGTASWYYPLTLNATANDSVLYLNNGVISIGKLLTNGTTSSYALELYNYNLATSGQTANWSPAFEMNGSAWNTSTATSNILRFRSEVQTTSGNPISGSIFWKSAITTSYSATPSFSNNLSLSNTNGLGLWNANTAASYLKASGSQASDIVYTFPASAPTTNQVLSASSVSGSSITLTWATASGSGTVNSGASGKVAYYPSAGTTVDDATALDYSTTSPHLTVTAQATTAIPLKLVGVASQSVDLFQVATSGGNVFTVGSAGISTFANNTAASGTTSGALIITGGIGVGSTSYLSTTNITTLTLTNALAVGQGGTGTSTAPNQWGVIFATSTSQYNSTAAGSTDQVLKSGGGTGAPSFGAINLASSNAVSNTLALSNGGLGTTTFTQNGVLYGNAATSILVTSASGAAGAILQTTTSGGAPSFSTTLPGTYSFSSSTAASSTTVAAVVFSGGIGVGSTSYLSDLYTVGTILSATSATTVNISTSAATKTINIGTGGTSTHTTSITIGSTAGTSTLTIDSPTVGTNTTSLTLFNTNATTVNAFGAGTALTLGATTGTTTIRNTTVTFTNATSFTGTSAAITMFGESTTFTLMGTTAASTTNIATGNNGTNAKTLNLATGGTGTGVVNVNVGVATGTFTVNSATSNIGTTAVSGVVAILSSSFTANNATSFSATSATTLSLGASTGTATIGNTTFTLTNATSITGTSAAITMFGESTSFTLLGTTATSTINIATGNNGTNAKTLNLGTGGTGTGVVNVNVGVATGTFTVNSATSNIGTTAVSGTVAVLSSTFTANNATSFSATSATTLSLGASTGTATIGNTTFTLTNATSITGTSAAITMFGESTSFTLLGTTATSTINIATGNNGTNAKTLNLATGGTGTGVVNVNVGVATGTFTVNSATSNIGTTAVSGTVAVLSSTFTANNATTFSATSATTLSLGASTGTATIGNTTFTLTNATSITGTSAAITMFGESTSFTLLGTTATSTINIATGNNGTNAKTLNLATGGTGTGTVSVNVGVATGTFTVNSATSNIGTTAVSGTVAVLSSTFTANNATSFSATSATTLSLGASTGTATIGNTTFTLTNATSITGTSAAITMFGESTSFTLMGTTATSTINIASGNNGTNTKTVNIGTGGAGAGNSNINIGVSTGTTSVKSSTFDLANATSITGSASLATVFATANPASLALFGAATTVTEFAAATTLSIGSTSGTITIANSTATFSGATANFSANTAFNLGTSVTGASTINIGTGAVAGQIKAINIGTGGSATGTSTIIIGTTSGTSTITLNGVTTLSSALAVGSGGTGTSSAPTQWGVIFATSTSAYNSTAAGSNNQWLRAVTSGAPTWSTATLATTYSQYDIVYASASNGLSGLTNTNTSVLVSQTAGPVWLQGATGNRLLKTSGSAISWSQADLTTDVTGVLPIANGGTQTSSITAGGVVYMGSTAATGLQALSPATANKFLVASGTATTNYPAWSTATLATTYAVGDLLYASGANTVGGLTSTATSVLITQGAAAPSWLQGATANRILKTSGSAISWAQVTLTTDVTGTLPVANGGTGLTTLTSEYIPYGAGTNAFASTSALTFSTSSGTLNATILRSSQSAGNEGGEIQLALAGTTTLTTGITIDVFNDRVRIFETGGTNRGAYIDLSAAGTGVSSNLLSPSGSGTVNSGAAGKIAYYPSASTVVDDATALDYSTTTTHLTITAQGAATSPLELVGAASQSANFFNIKNSSGTSVITMSSIASGASAKLTIAGTGSNTDDLFSITNGGSLTVAGGTSGANRGVRLNLRGAGNQTNDSTIFNITNGAGDLTPLNFSADGTTGYGMQINQASSGYALSIKFPEDATTNTVKDVLSIERTTSGTAAAGIGARMVYRQEHAGGTLVQSASIDGLLSNAGSTTYVGALVFNTNTAGSTTLAERVRIDNSSVQLSPIGTTAGSTNELRFLELAATGTNYTAFKAPDSLSAEIVYTLPSTGPSANQVLAASSVSGTSVTLAWATDATGSGGSGVVNSGASGKIAYYPALGTTVDDATALDYSTTSPHLTITAQATTAIPLKLTGVASQSVDLFQVATSGGNVLTVGSAGISTFANNTAASNTTSGALIVTGGIGVGSTSYLSDLYSVGTILSATSATTVNISTSAATKTINIGTGGTSTHTTAITIGTASGTSTLSLNGTVSLSSPLSVGSGGTGTSSAATQWGMIFATTSTQYASTAAGSTNQWMRAVTSSAPTWSTATLATTYAAGDLLYASASNTVGGLTSTATSVLITQGAAAPSWLQGATGNRLLKTSGSAISWGQVDLASGDVTGTLAVGSGGTGTSTAPTQWGVMFATSASAIRSTAAPTSTNQLLAGVSGGAPVWSTATFATTYSAGQFLYASGANTVSGLATTTLSVDTTNIRIGVGTSAANTPLHILNNGTGTNAVVVMETHDIQSTGTPAAGFGGSILFDLESSTTAGQDAASIEAVWATATHATRLAELNFKTNDVNTSTLTERMSISNITSAQSSTNATVVITGTLGVNSTSYLSSVSLNTALAIASGGTNTSSFATSNGLVYFNGTNLLTTNATASGVVVTSGTNVPSVATDIPTSVTIGGGYIYRGGGTDVPLADGGTNASLTANQGGVIYSTASAMAINTPGSSGQPLLSGGTGAPTFGTLGMGAGGTGLTTTTPGANYILGMNASNNGLEYKQLVQGSNITITHAANQVTITASGGSATAGGSNTQIQYNNATALAGIANFTFASNLVSLTNATNFANTSTPGMELKYSTAAGTTTVNNNSPALDFIGRIYASAADRHARIREEIQTTAATPAHALVWSSSYDTGTASYTKVLSLHTVDGVGFWNYAGTPGTAANYFKTGNQASDIRYTWPTAAPTTNQVLSATGVSGSDITLGWATAGGGAGTVGSGTINQLAYYSGATTTASDASLVRAATGTHLTITAQGATTSPLKVVGAASQSAALFTVATSGADVFVVGSAGAITTGTWNGTAIGVLYGGTGQTTYTDGQLLIGNSTGNTLTKATLTAGSGVAVTNGSGSITVRQKRPLTLTFCSGYTPAATGADSVVLRIPDSPADGSTSLTYNLRKLFMRVETPSAGTSTVQVEYYTGTSAFSATNLLSSALSATGASTYEFSSSGFSTSTLASGTKLRLNFTAVNATHANFFIQLLLEEN